MSLRDTLSDLPYDNSHRYVVHITGKRSVGSITLEQACAEVADGIHRGAKRIVVWEMDKDGHYLCTHPGFWQCQKCKWTMPDDENNCWGCDSERESA